MKYELEGSKQLMIGLLVALAVLVGATAITLDSWGGVEEKNRDYKNLLNNIDHTIASMRLGDDASGYLNSAEGNYESIVSGRTFENGSDLQELHKEIENTFSSLRGGGVSIIELFDLRSNASEMAVSLGASIPLAFHFPPLIVLMFSISLAFLATLLCRLKVDWEELTKVKDSFDEWKKRMMEAKRKKGKKKRKLELKDEERREKQLKIWKISIKQAVFYLAPFFLLLPLISLVYGEWIIAWLPFNWFTSGFLKAIGVSLGSIGWFAFTYFVFAWIWRDILV